MSKGGTTQNGGDLSRLGMHQQENSDGLVNDILESAQGVQDLDLRIDS